MKARAAAAVLLALVVLTGACAAPGTPPAARTSRPPSAAEPTGPGTGPATGSTVLPPAEPDLGGTGPRGWTLVATENFTGPLDRHRWTPYDGKPGCCPDTVWRPARARISNGTLLLENRRSADGRWTSGGVGSWTWPVANRLHGRVDVRLRADRAPGISMAALLWPDRGWPPEIDFFETFPEWPDRRRMRVTSHFGARDLVRQAEAAGDFTRWHVISLRWDPDRVRVLVDGRQVADFRDPRAVPQQRMWIAFQTHVHRDRSGALPTMPAGRTQVGLAVDWVRIYRRSR
ncbi:glycoside hydrolase family 16 protein [Marmoricola sp. RAF53]|uniref:glycoside hydrolase family 16 protein n=1 Tax=Marmoricola sp. RAF53 TaxID=3233059 RepID=UPI003F985727